MNLTLSHRLSQVKPSPTFAILAKARAMRAQGLDVTLFNTGEPNFDTPASIKDAARRGLDEGVAGYTPTGGLEPLRTAIANELNNVHQTSLASSQIIVSTGAKHSLSLIFSALLNRDDEVIVIAPYWVSYPDMIHLAGGTPVIVDTQQTDFIPTQEALSKAITKKTRAILINTPSNPTGVVYSKQTLQMIGDLAQAHDLLLIDDSIYRHLIYDGVTYHSLASLSPQIAERTIIVDGISKAYAMTGWRIGYTAGPQALIDAMMLIQGQSTSNATHIAQIAALAALTGSQEPVAEMRDAFRERRDIMYKLLQTIPDVKTILPQGAFYMFVDLTAYLNKKTPDGTVINNDEDLCLYLIDHHLIAAVPGISFGACGFIRLSYTITTQHIQQGIERLKTALQELK